VSVWLKEIMECPAYLASIKVKDSPTDPQDSKSSGAVCNLLAMLNKLRHENSYIGIVGEDIFGHIRHSRGCRDALLGMYRKAFCRFPTAGSSGTS